MAHDKGMCVMKHQMVSDGKLQREILVEKIGVVDMDGNSVWYPQKAYRTVHIENLEMIKEELTVTEFVPNVEVNDSTFRLVYPPGSHVTDKILGLSYVVGGAGPAGEVAPVRDISPAEKRQTEIEAARKTPEIVKPSSETEVEKVEQPIERDTQKEEITDPDESIPDKKRILGIQTISVFGVVILTGIGLLLWRKRSAVK